MRKIDVAYSTVSILYESNVTYVIEKRGKNLIPTIWREIEGKENMEKTEGRKKKVDGERGDAKKKEN